MNILSQNFIIAPEHNKLMMNFYNCPQFAPCVQSNILKLAHFVSFVGSIYKKLGKFKYNSIFSVKKFAKSYEF